MSLGENIKARRQALKLSQEYVAEQLGVSRQAVSKWETDRTEPTARNLADLAQLLDIPLAELAGADSPAETEEERQKENLRRNMQIVTVGAYSGAVALTGVHTNDPGFRWFALAFVFALAVLMARNVMRLPVERRRKTALQELAYCALVYCIMTFLTPVIGNVLAGGLVCVCCVIYATKFRFPS